VIVTIAGVWN